tara:strand:+ start:336 stop:773 length:438 start_codon:yes stop_codon:yes gene_type:complete
MLGNSLRDRDVQYTAMKDTTTHTWRILDTWHDDLRQISPEDDIPDDSEAVKIITEGAFLALIREAARLGVLENASFGNDEEYNDDHANEQLQEMRDQIVKYEKEIIILKSQVQTSESFKLKEQALGVVLKLAAMSDAALLSEDKI